ncbi:MAG: hypothetical protein H0V89_07835 [Deltaproteobacteria bacterium]|nr:hypothetical protein [Deltaproteobacteria bacterium]
MRVLWLAMACGTASEPEPTRRAPHYDDWPLLLDAVRAGDVATARTRARDLASGSEVGSTGLGAALGLLQVAEDPAELEDGVDAAARACDACHRENLREIAVPTR